MNSWEKTKIVSGAMAALAVPTAIALMAHLYGAAMKERELQGAFVHIAVDLLNSLPTEDSKNLRIWAEKVVDKYSGVPLSLEARAEVIERIPLPTSSSGNFSILNVKERKALSLSYLTKLKFFSNALAQLKKISMQGMITPEERSATGMMALTLKGNRALLKGKRAAFYASKRIGYPPTARDQQLLRELAERVLVIPKTPETGLTMVSELMAELRAILLYE